MRPAQNSAIHRSANRPSRFQRARKWQREPSLAEGSEAICWRQQRLLRRDALTINRSQM